MRQPVSRRPSVPRFVHCGSVIAAERRFRLAAEAGLLGCASIPAVSMSMSALHLEFRSKLADAVVDRGWRNVEVPEPNTLEAALATPPVVGATLTMGHYRKAASGGFVATAWLVQECECLNSGAVWLSRAKLARVPAGPVRPNLLSRGGILG